MGPLIINQHQTPRERIAIFKEVITSGEKIRIKQVLQHDAYYNNDLIGLTGEVVKNDMNQLLFVCEVNEEKHGLKTGKLQLLFSGIIFERLNGSA